VNGDKRAQVHYGDFILRVLDCEYIVTISFRCILYCGCFNLYCGCINLFCNVWMCVCVFLYKFIYSMFHYNL